MDANNDIQMEDAQISAAEMAGYLDPDVMDPEEVMAMFGEGNKEALKEKLVDADFYNGKKKK